MARFTGNGGLRILLHGERYCFGGEPKEPIKFRVTEGGNLKSPIRVRSRGRSFGHQGLSRVSAAGKKMGNSKGRERLKSEDYDDTDDDNEDDDDDDDEFDVDELACFRGLVLDISYRRSMIKHHIRLSSFGWSTTTKLHDDPNSNVSVEDFGYFLSVA